MKQNKSPAPPPLIDKLTALPPTGPGVKAPAIFVTPDIQPGGSEPSLFSITRQGTATNELTKQLISPGEAFTIDPFTQIASITRGALQLSFIDFKEFTGLKLSTHRLLEALIMTFTETGSQSKTIKIGLRDYMELCGLKNLKETRKQVNADLWAIRRTSITFTDKTGGGPGRNYINVALAQDHGIVNSAIILTLGDVFFEILKSYPLMPIHRLTFKLDTRTNTNSYPLFRKIQEHKRINAGGANENTLSVKTLLGVCQGLPSYADVMAGNRNLRQRIIDPFERDLDALEEALSWEYCHTNGTPLTAEELENFTYELFETLLIKATWREYPDQTALIEGKKKRAKAARARKNASKKKGGAD